jgi:hypothetical protein
MNQNNGNVFVLIPKGGVSHQCSQFEDCVAYKVLSPLSNITLANEMMDENNVDDDMKLFSDIIKRNCNRINQLIIDSRMELSSVSV